MNANTGISKITIWPLRVPVPRERLLCPPFAHEPLARGASGKYFDGEWFADQVIYAVKAESSDGIAGFGDVSHAYKSTDELAAVASAFIGLSETDITTSNDPTPKPANTRGLHSAVLDWKARRQGVPFYAMFGKRIRDRVKVSMWTGFRTPEGAAAVAREAFEKYGIRSLKLKAGEDTDCGGIVAAVSQAVGGRDYDLAIDPNGRWPDIDDVVRRGKEAVAAADGIRVYFEDPGLKDEQCPEIKKRSGIALVRTCAGAEGVANVVNVCQADLLNLVRDWDSMVTGAAAAQKLGVPFWAGSAATSGLGDLVSLHFALTQPAFTFGADMAASQSRDHDLLSESIKITDGYAHVPDGPGMGLDLDMTAVEKYAAGEPVVVQ